GCPSVRATESVWVPARKCRHPSMVAYGTGLVFQKGFKQRHRPERDARAGICRRRTRQDCL
ncbi:MAG: hypothetical protein AVDCRST_MAG93-8369, partial [uncultured Chloroflexia bacterium]